MELKDAITDLLRREGLSQKELATRAGVHQTTVSRALRQIPARRGRAHARLCTYMQQHAASLPSEAGALVDAVRETWDGSQEHAAALADLILASGELWPGLGKEAAQ